MIHQLKTDLTHQIFFVVFGDGVFGSFVVEELLHRLGPDPDRLGDVVHVHEEPLESRNLSVSQHF